MVKSMTKLLKQNKRTSLGWSVLLIFLVSACDTANVASDQTVTGDLDVPAAALIEGLDLSNNQAEQVVDVMNKYDTQQPGRLWYISAELQQTLTEDQKAELIASFDDEGFRSRGVRGDRGARGFSGKIFEELDNPLTDEQKEQLETFHEEQRASMRALLKERRAGTITDEAFKTQMEEARANMRATLEEILTEEQQNELQEKKEQYESSRGNRRNRGDRNRFNGQRGPREGASEIREEFQAAMIDALALSEEQQEQLKQVREEVRAQMEELRGQFDRDNPEATREAIQNLHETAKEKSESIFTDSQQETMAIHRALMQEVRSTSRKDKRAR